MECLFCLLYIFNLLDLIALVLLYVFLILLLMNFLSNLFIVSFGEIDISPFMFALIIFLTLFVFLAVLVSTIKLIQSLVNEVD